MIQKYTGFSTPHHTTPSTHERQANDNVHTQTIDRTPRSVNQVLLDTALPNFLYQNQKPKYSSGPPHLLTITPGGRSSRQRKMRLAQHGAHFICPITYIPYIGYADAGHTSTPAVKGCYVQFRRKSYPDLREERTGMKSSPPTNNRLHFSWYP